MTKHQKKRDNIESQLSIISTPPPFRATGSPGVASPPLLFNSWGFNPNTLPTYLQWVLG